MECLKFARLVFRNRPVNSDLSEKAMACTTKSMLGQRSPNWAKAASNDASSVTSTSTMKSLPTLSASGFRRLPKASP